MVLTLAKKRRFRKRRAGVLKSGMYRKIKRARYRYNKRTRSGYTFAKQITMGNFPPRKTCLLKYTDVIALDASATSIAAYVFRANSVYDPDYTGAGHQPMFFDNYASLYQRYKVNYSTIKMTILNQRVGNVLNSVTATEYYANNEKCLRMFIIRDTEVDDFPTDLNLLIEEGNRNFKWKYAPQMQSGRLNQLTYACVPHKQTNLNYKDDTLTSSIASNPASPCYFIVGVGHIGDGINPAAMAVQITVTYNVTFYDIKKLQTQN